MEAPAIEWRPTQAAIAIRRATVRLRQSRHGDGAIRFDRSPALR